MTLLTVVAHITAKDDKIEFVKEQLNSVIAPTLAEKGCVQYDLHQDNNNPAHFVFYENWESRELLMAHLGSDHIKQMGANLAEALAAPTVIHEMTFIGKK